MLAYVFWHWPAAGRDPKAYEESLVGFHHSLTRSKPEGFERSAVFRLTSAPWIGLPTPTRLYEDWYFLRGSCALDLLNEAAVTGITKEFHDRAAQAAGGGTAGLYRLRSAEPAMNHWRYAFWFAKPGGTSYQQFYEQLRSWTDQPSVSLWQRQMVLGPTPEFCLLGPARLDLPGEWTPLLLTLDPVWP